MSFERRQFTLTQLDKLPVRPHDADEFGLYHPKREYRLNADEQVYEKTLTLLREVMGDHIAKKLREIDPRLTRTQDLIKAVRRHWTYEEIDYQMMIAANLIAQYAWDKTQNLRPEGFFEQAEKFVDSLGLDSEGRRVFKSALFDRTIHRGTITVVRIQ